MRDVLLLVWLLSGVARGTQPKGGYCIGNSCIAVFDLTLDFSGAQDICQQHKGNLMTVRSSVAHDTLSLLLGNSSGQHWIGLHLPEGCPDTTSNLRGFQWITEDTTSDFFNWAEDVSMGSCSSSSSYCIYVSNDNNFQWREDFCEQSKNGFLCEFVSQDLCVGFKNMQVVYTTPYGFTVDDATSLPAGSIAELPDETRQVCASRQWLKAPWRCEIQQGGCEHKCTMNPENIPVCYCPPGSIVNPANDRTCEPADDDPCLQLKCAHACYKFYNSFLCTCNNGFVLADDGRSCIDFNECSDERQCPADEEKCVNTPGGFDCICESGYRLNGGTCVDINECISSPCEHICNNTPGGYDCSCYEGYKVNPSSPNDCMLYCGKVECPAQCDPNNKYQCYCPEGYILEERGDHSICLDIDECDSYDNCDHHCENSFGSYICFCDQGYTLVDKEMCEKGSGGAEMVTEPMEVFSAAPTHRPSAVSVGGLVGIIICTVFFVLLAVFLLHHILYGKAKPDSPATAKSSGGPEAQNLQQVTIETVT